MVLCQRLLEGQQPLGPARMATGTPSSYGADRAHRRSTACPPRPAETGLWGSRCSLTARRFALRRWGRFRQPRWRPSRAPSPCCPLRTARPTRRAASARVGTPTAVPQQLSLPPLRLGVLAFKKNAKAPRRPDRDTPHSRPGAALNAITPPRTPESTAAPASSRRNPLAAALAFSNLKFIVCHQRSGAAGRRFA
jgi:hypothetical protein